MTPAEFKASYPTFDTVSDAEIQRQIDVFGCLYQGDYGCLAPTLLGLFTAHQVTVSTASGSGPIQSLGSRSVGDVSVSFNAIANPYANDFAGTKYGLEFSRLIRMFGMGPIMSGTYRGIY